MPLKVLLHAWKLCYATWLRSWGRRLQRRTLFVKTTALDRFCIFTERRLQITEGHVWQLIIFMVNWHGQFKGTAIWSKGGRKGPFRFTFIICTLHPPLRHHLRVLLFVSWHWQFHKGQYGRSLNQETWSVEPHVWKQLHLIDFASSVSGVCKLNSHFTLAVSPWLKCLFWHVSLKFNCNFFVDFWNFGDHLLIAAAVCFTHYCTIVQ